MSEPVAPMSPGREFIVPLQDYLEVSHVKKPFERIGMDILVPFSLSKKNNRYIIVAVDYVTKLLETKAVAVADAAEVAKFFTENILLRHGAHRALNTNQRKCFTAEVMQVILKNLN